MTKDTAARTKPNLEADKNPSWWLNTKQSTLFIIKRILQRNLTRVASSLTFTTILAIVPLFAVILALFTAFPLFSKFQEALQHFLSSNLMPEVVSENVMLYLNEFASKASSLTAIGSLFLIITSIMLISTIDETFNAIWLVAEQRPLTQRILVYWAILSLGPIIIGGSLWASSVLASESFGLISNLSILASFALSYVPFVLTALAFSALFAYVPNHRVLWRDAFTGGVLTTLLLQVLKTGFTFYLIKFPTYTLIYGAFAAIPIFLMWIYLSWMIVLLGASLVAILPSLRNRNWISTQETGANYLNSLSILSLLWQHRSQSLPGLSVEAISKSLKRDASALTNLLKKLKSHGYVVNTTEKNDERWVLACDPALTPLSPLVDVFLVDRAQADTPTAQCAVQLLNATVAHPALTLHTLLAHPEALLQHSNEIQKRLITEYEYQGVNHAKG